MEKTIPFGKILEAADQLPLGDQESLRDVLIKRIIERRRDEILEEIREARKEFGTDKCRPATPDDLMSEILS